MGVIKSDVSVTGNGKSAIKLTIVRPCANRIMSREEVRGKRKELFSKKLIPFIIESRKMINLSDLYKYASHLYTNKLSFYTDAKKLAAEFPTVQFKSFKGIRGGYFMAPADIDMEVSRTSVGNVILSYKSLMDLAAKFPSVNSAESSIKYLDNYPEKYVYINDFAYKGQAIEMDIHTDKWKPLQTAPEFTAKEKVLMVWKEVGGGRYIALIPEGMYLYDRVPCYM